MASAQPDFSCANRGATQTEGKSSKRTQHFLGLCDNLVNALKLLANQLKDGDSPIQSIITG